LRREKLALSAKGKIVLDAARGKGPAGDNLYTSTMSLEYWYYIAGIASAVIGLLALVGLGIYAYDTRQLRIAAQDQTEATMKPCAVVVPDPSNGGIDGPLLLKNVGVGVALNIRWRYTGKDYPWREFPALGPGESRHVSTGIGPHPLGMSLSLGK
jgi:hypothetical protein